MVPGEFILDELFEGGAVGASMVSWVSALRFLRGGGCRTVRGRGGKVKAA